MPAFSFPASGLPFPDQLLRHDMLCNDGSRIESLGVLMSGGLSHSEFSRRGGQARTVVKLRAAMENLCKARQVLQDTRRTSPKTSKLSVSTKHQSPEPAKVEGNQLPVAGQRYVNRNGVYVLAERAAPGELVFRFDGQDFYVCGRLRDK
jgi:hypothetical protein